MFIFGKCSAFAINNLQRMQSAYGMMTRRCLQVYSTLFKICDLSQTQLINGSVIGSEKRDYLSEFLKVNVSASFHFCQPF